MGIRPPRAHCLHAGLKDTGPGSRIGYGAESNPPLTNIVVDEGYRFGYGEIKIRERNRLG